MNMAATNTSPANRLETLELFGVGISVEMFRQEKLWSAMQESGDKSILPTEPRAYPASLQDREDARRQGAAKAIESAIKSFADNWPIPVVSIWPQLHAEQAGQSAQAFENWGDDLLAQAGLFQHKVVSVGTFFHDTPEEILERAFQFFQGHADVPALLLLVSDGDMLRKLTGDINRQSHWESSKRKFDSMAETTVALLLGKRDRIDALRPFMPAPETRLHAAGSTPTNFVSSKFIPAPWTYSQFQMVDALPTIAQIHRPVRVSYRKLKTDAAASPNARASDRMYAQERETVFKTSLQNLLQSDSGLTPARIFYDTGGPAYGAHIVPLAQATGSLLPDFDLFKADEGYDISTRIGNTGAASPLVQWALAAMASAKGRNVSVAVNLRRDEEATLTLISPAQRRAGLRAGTNEARSTAATPARTQQRHVPLGTRRRSGDECPQNGIWRCDPPDAEAGETHLIMAGRRLPPVRVRSEVNTWKKLRGEGQYKLIDAVYTLVSFDEGSA